MSCEVWVFLYSSLPPVPVYHLISVTRTANHACTVHSNSSTERLSNVTGISCKNKKACA